MSPKQLAIKLHEGQFRRDGVTPYWSHLQEVAAPFEVDTFEYDTAWLHDSKEDTNVTDLDFVKAGVHWVVIEAVNILTHRKHEPYLSYIERIFSGDSLSHKVAKAVKLSDLSSNLGGEPTPRQIKKYAAALRLIAKSYQV